MTIRYSPVRIKPAFNSVQMLYLFWVVMMSLVNISSEKDIITARVLDEPRLGT